MNIEPFHSEAHVNQLELKKVSNEEWSSQLWTQFMQWRRKPEKPEPVNPEAWTRDLAIPLRCSNRCSESPSPVILISINGTKQYTVWVFTKCCRLLINYQKPTLKSCRHNFRVQGPELWLLLRKRRVQLPQDWFVTPTWPPFNSVLRHQYHGGPGVDAQTVRQLLLIHCVDIEFSMERGLITNLKV